jgi:hypothetical protein
MGFMGYMGYLQVDIWSDVFGQLGHVGLAEAL